MESMQAKPDLLVTTAAVEVDIPVATLTCNLPRLVRQGLESSHPPDPQGGLQKERLTEPLEEAHVDKPCHAL